MVKTYDPLKCIPSADAVRKRLAETREEARRLGILLRTAEQIEQEKEEREIVIASDVDLEGFLADLPAMHDEGNEIAMTTAEDKFWAVLTHKRDEGLAHLTSIIDRSGSDEFCAFLGKHVMPAAVSDPDDQDMLVEHVIAHMAIVGAVDALLAWRDRQEEGE
jgi:hypothetical protein